MKKLFNKYASKMTRHEIFLDLYYFLFMIFIIVSKAIS